MNKNIDEGFVQVAGGNIWYKRMGKGDGAPLIVLHGGPGYPHDYLEPLEDLAEERQIIFYDQLGCGNSDRSEDTSLWKVDRFVSELNDLIKALKLSSYHLLGHSWGAALAISFALEKPGGLQSIILSGPYLSTPIWEKDANRLIKKLPEKFRKVLNKHTDPKILDTEEFKKASDEYYKEFVFRLDPMPVPILRADNKMSRAIYNHMWGPKELAATGTLKSFDLTPRLSEINNPVQLICGKFDEATPEAGGQFKKLFPNAQLAIMEKSAHMSHWTDRSKFLRTVSEFLKNN